MFNQLFMLVQSMLVFDQAPNVLVNVRLLLFGENDSFFFVFSVNYSTLLFEELAKVSQCKSMVNHGFNLRVQFRLHIKIKYLCSQHHEKNEKIVYGNYLKNKTRFQPNRNNAFFFFLFFFVINSF